LEGFEIRIVDHIDGLGIEGMAHLANQGDTSWQTGFIGTRHEHRAVEGLALRLSGPRKDDFSIWYQAHLANAGWQPAVSDGVFTGTRGHWRPVEAIVVGIITSEDSRRLLDTSRDPSRPEILSKMFEFRMPHLPIPISSPRTIMFKSAQLGCDPTEHNALCPIDKFHHSDGHPSTGGTSGGGGGGGGTPHESHGKSADCTDKPRVGR
jgi:uncharacterized protein YjdB